MDFDADHKTFCSLQKLLDNTLVTAFLSYVGLLLLSCKKHANQAAFLGVEQDCRAAKPIHYID